MNPQLQARIAKAQARIQGMWGEQLTLGPVATATKVCAIMGRESLDQRFIEGKGMEEVVTLSVSVRVGDLPAAPFKGQQAQARGRSWHVWLVSPTQTTYEITLESPNK